MAELETRIKKSEKDIKHINKDTAAINLDLNTKTNNDETIRIWKNFNKYAEFNDLKDLYAKVFPEIRKFEDR